MEMETMIDENGRVIQRSEACKDCDQDQRYHTSWCHDSHEGRSMYTECQYGNCSGYKCPVCGKWK